MGMAYGSVGEEMCPRGVRFLPEVLPSAPLLPNAHSGAGGAGLRGQVLRGETVAHAAHGLDVPGGGGVVAELTTQVRHVRLDRALVGVADEVARDVRLAAQHERQVSLDRKSTRLNSSH